MAAEKEETRAASSSSSSSAAPAPLRPTLMLPPRNPLGFAGYASPGPMTLVSSFFADDPDSDCRSFSQLLAGAIASPAARQAAAEGGGGGVGEESGREAGSGVRQNRQLGMLAVPAQGSFFTVPPGISPTSFLESPVLFSTSPGRFGISHQEALAQVTAQAALSRTHMHGQADYPSSNSAGASASIVQPTTSAGNAVTFQESYAKSLTSDLEDGSQVDQKPLAAPVNADKPADDGYNWRKYGQKQVKGSEYPRSYYKCTHSNCPVKKKVERSLDGQVTEIIYKGGHNHPLPPSKRAKDRSTFPSESNGNNRNLTEANQFGQVTRPNDTFSEDFGSGQAIMEQLSGSSEGDEAGDAEGGTDERDATEPDSKRRIVDNTIIKTCSHKTVTEPRIIVQTTSEVDLLDDGYRWRKYGQKVVKGNPHPRSYYKCTYAGCGVRKHVERASENSKAVITTYEGKHNHDVPAARNSSHNTATSTNIIQPRVQNASTNQGLHRRTELRSYDQQPAAVLQLKEEHEIT